MSARDKFYATGINATVEYVKNTTIQLPDITFLVSSSSPDTILQVLPTSSIGIKFYTPSGNEITPLTKLALQPNQVSQIIAKIDTTNFNNISADTFLEFPVKFDLVEVAIPTPSASDSPPPPPGMTGGFVCRPCFADESVNRSGGCPPGQVCMSIGGQRCCVEEDGSYRGSVPPWQPE